MARKSKSVKSTANTVKSTTAAKAGEAPVTALIVPASCAKVPEGTPADRIGWHGELIHSEHVSKKEGEPGVYIFDGPLHLGMEMVYVPPCPFQDVNNPQNGGGFLFGEKKTPLAISRGQYIGRYPCTVAEYKWFCHTTSHPLPPEPQFFQDGTHPVVNVSWIDAKKFCQATGLNLPTEFEWEYAARGTDGRTYPWGEEAPNDDLLIWSGTKQRSGTESVIGTCLKGASPFGALHMSGNVWEWTDSPHLEAEDLAKELAKNPDVTNARERMPPPDVDSL